MVRLLLVINRNICLENCFFGALTSFFARTESWAGFDALERFALLIEAVSVAAVLVLAKQGYFLDKNSCLAKTRTAADEKRENVLEPPH